MSIKRYGVVVAGWLSSPVEESDRGDYVLFADHEADKKKAVEDAVKEKDERIEALERALRIESNDPEERTQEAAHYNYLEDKLQEKDRQIEELVEALGKARAIIFATTCYTERQSSIVKDDIDSIEKALESHRKGS